MAQISRYDDAVMNSINS